MTIQLRLATMNDADCLLACRNDTETREASHNTEEIQREEHITWLNKLINDPDRTLYIAEEDSVFVGTARVDKLEKTHLLSWAVAPRARGRGVGKMIVKKMCYEISGTICAEIKKENLASINIAKAVGMNLIKEIGGVLYFIKD